jgi:hypothetical protein
MSREINVELRHFLLASETGDLPLQVYDALYYSGKFDPIYRMQGDMVLGAYYNPYRKKSNPAVSLVKRLMKELTIELKEKPRGFEVRVEHLMPTSEEESRFFREPKTKLSVKSTTAPARFIPVISEMYGALRAAIECISSIEALKPLDRTQLLVSHLEHLPSDSVKVSDRLRYTVSGNAVTFDMPHPLNQSLLSEIASALKIM